MSQELFVLILVAIGLVVIFYMFNAKRKDSVATRNTPSIQSSPQQVTNSSPVTEKVLSASQPTLQTQSPTTNQQSKIEIKNSYGIGDGSPLLVDSAPDLDRIFTDPNTNWPQVATSQNRDWHEKADIKEKRMALAIAYLQHPKPEVRKSTLAHVRDIDAARVSQMLYDMLMFEPDKSMRVAIAQLVWERERNVNCKYAVNSLKDEVEYARNAERKKSALSSLDLLIEVAPNLEAKQAVEAQITGSS